MWSENTNHKTLPQQVEKNRKNIAELEVKVKELDEGKLSVEDFNSWVVETFNPSQTQQDQLINTNTGNITTIFELLQAITESRISVIGVKKSAQTIDTSNDIPAELFGFNQTGSTYKNKNGERTNDPNWDGARLTIPVNTTEVDWVLNLTQLTSNSSQRTVYGIYNESTSTYVDQDFMIIQTESAGEVEGKTSYIKIIVDGINVSEGDVLLIRLGEVEDLGESITVSPIDPDGGEQTTSEVYITYTVGGIDLSEYDTASQSYNRNNPIGKLFETTVENGYPLAPNSMTGVTWVLVGQAETGETFLGGGTATTKEVGQVKQFTMTPAVNNTIDVELTDNGHAHSMVDIKTDISLVIDSTSGSSNFTRPGVETRNTESANSNVTAEITGDVVGTEQTVGETANGNIAKGVYVGKTIYKYERTA